MFYQCFDQAHACELCDRPTRGGHSTLKAVEKRDKNQLEVEDQEATIAMTKAESAKMRDEVSALSKEIGGLQKEQNFKRL